MYCRRNLFSWYFRMLQRIRLLSWPESMHCWTQPWILVSTLSDVYLRRCKTKNVFINRCTITERRNAKWACFVALMFCCRLGWAKSVSTSANSAAFLWLFHRLSWFSAHATRLEISEPIAYGRKGWRTFYGKLQWFEVNADWKRWWGWSWSIVPCFWPRICLIDVCSSEKIVWEKNHNCSDVSRLFLELLSCVFSVCGYYKDGQYAYHHSENVVKFDIART